MQKLMRCGWIAGVLAGLALTSGAATVRMSAGALRLGAATVLRGTNFTLNSAATLAGSGTVQAPAVLAGTISPGNSVEDIGTLTFTDAVRFEAGLLVAHAATDTSLDRIAAGAGVSGTATVRMTKANGTSPWRQILIAAAAASEYNSFAPDAATVWVGSTNARDLLVSWNRSQTITFDAIADQNVNQTVTLQATASSGLPVNFDVTAGPGVIAGSSNLNFTALGTVNVRAAQAGGGGWYPATDVARAVNVLEYYQALAADVDGDGKADPIVYDMSTGTWRVRLSSENYAREYTYAGFLGGVGLEAVTADFDGDGKGDIAVYTAATGSWQARLSSDGYGVLHNYPNFLGGAGWAPLAGDFDRDRRADPAVYAVANAQWQAKLSQGGYSLYTTSPNFLGGLGWAPLAGDLDGDGQADVAIYNEATGQWMARFSTDGYGVLYQTSVGWLGGPGLAGALADLDGDGIADPAVRDATHRQWQARMSGNGYGSILVTADNWL